MMKRLYPSFANPETWRNDTQENITSEAWRKLRWNILKRDNYTCQYCGFRAEKWQIVHHIDGNPNNNEETNLETICSMCNLIHHSGQGCVVQGVVDLFRKSNYSQNEIIQITRKMRAKGKTDQELINFLGLKEKVPFKMERQYLKKLYGFVTSRKTDQDWTQKGLEYGYKIVKETNIFKSTINRQTSIESSSSTTLANFVGSVLTHSDNTVYAVRFAHPNARLHLALLIYRCR